MRGVVYAFFLGFIGLLYIVSDIFGTQTAAEEDILELKTLACFIGSIVIFSIDDLFRKYSR